MADRSRWISTLHSSRTARMRLLCVPYAGGGAAGYRSLAAHAPEWLEVAAVNLPGREGRYADPAIDNMSDMVDAIGDALCREEGPPYALLGHSMGALIAFELARGLPETRAPDVLIVSGMNGPQTRRTSSRPIASMSDSELVSMLQSNESYSSTLRDTLADPELAELFLPMLRADFHLVDTYRHQAASKLDVPIVCLSGLQDRHDPTRLDAWGELTNAPYRRHDFDGGHFFIQSAAAIVMQRVREALHHLKRFA